MFAPPRLRAGSERRFQLHHPRGSFPHPASPGSSGSHPSGKDISNRFEPFPPGLEFEIISVRVLSEFYIVNTLPDLAPLSEPVLLGCPGMGSAAPALPGWAGGAFLLVQLAETGGSSPDSREPSLTGRESP